MPKWLRSLFYSTIYTPDIDGIDFSKQRSNELTKCKPTNASRTATTSHTLSGMDMKNISSSIGFDGGE